MNTFTSEQIALDLEKDHRYIIKKIRDILDTELLDDVPGFNPIYTDTSTDEKNPSYTLNEDAFLELISTFTGKRALNLKRKLFLQYKSNNKGDLSLALSDLLQSHHNELQQELSKINDRVSELETVPEYEGDNYYVASNQINIATEIQLLWKAMQKDIPHLLQQQFPKIKDQAYRAVLCFYRLHDTLHVEDLNLMRLMTQDHGGPEIATLKFIVINPELHERVYQTIDAMKRIIKSERKKRGRTDEIYQSTGNP